MSSPRGSSAADRDAERAARRALELAQLKTGLLRVLEHTPEGLILLDEERTVLLANPVAARLLGSTPAQLAERPFEYPVAPGGLVQLDLVCDGAPVHVEMRSVVLEWEGRLACLVSLRDVTEHRHAAETLRSLQQAVETMQLGLTICDLDGTIRYANPAEERAHGYAPGELTGCPASVLGAPELRNGSEADRQAQVERIRDLRSFRRTSVNVRKDGSRFPVQLHSDVVTDSDGRPVGIVTTCEDITDRQAAEQLALERTRTLERTRALERSNQDLDQFAYVASHDLQEPLRKITGFGERLAEEYHEALDATGRDYLRRMIDAARRMRSLIQDLLAYSRLSTRPQTLFPVNLGAVARQVLSDLELHIEQLGARVEVQPLPAVHADPIEMRQLLQNLVGNALKFHRQDVVPEVRIYARPASARAGRSDPAAEAGELCELCVEDNGIGFDERHLSRIFTIFQRLHARSEYEGTGIGLAICKRIAERHGGSITATSTPGQGSCFVVLLPVRQVQPPAADSEP